MKKKKPPQAPPKEGMSITLLTGSQSFQTISNKDIPSFGGAWGGFFLGVGLLPCLWSRVFFTPLAFWRGGGGEAFFLFFFLPQRFVGVCSQLSLQFRTRREDHTRLNRLSLKGFFCFCPFARQCDTHRTEIALLPNAYLRSVRCGEHSYGIRIQQKPCPLGTPSPFTSLRSVTVGSGRDGVGLLGLLKRLRPEPGVAVVATHSDGTTAEVQVVCAATIRWVST